MTLLSDTPLPETQNGYAKRMTRRIATAGITAGVVVDPRSITFEVVVDHLSTFEAVEAVLSGKPSKDFPAKDDERQLAKTLAADPRVIPQFRHMTAAARQSRDLYRVAIYEDAPRSRRVLEEMTDAQLVFLDSVGRGPKVVRNYYRDIAR